MHGQAEIAGEQAGPDAMPAAPASNEAPQDAAPNLGREGNPRPDSAVKSRRLWWLAAVVTLVIACVPAAVWIGDAPWNVDEPALVAVAYYCNELGVLATHGLRGNFSIPYGPLPTYTHQLLLHVSHDPRVMLSIRAVLCAAVVSVSLLWLARSLALSPWFAAAVVLAPLLWCYNRMMWDASLAIPVGALAWAAYAGFVRTRSGAALLLAIACAMSVLLIHPQTLPLAVAIFAHLLWSHRAELRRYAVPIAALVGTFAGLNFAYACAAVRAVVTQAGGMLHSGHPIHTTFLRSALGPLMGGVLLSGRAFVGAYGLPAGPPRLIGALSVIVDGFIPLVWAGVALCAWREIRRWHARRRVGRRSVVVGGAASAEAARDTVCRVALIALGLQILLHAAARVPVLPQYFLGSFAFDVLFAWVAVEALAHARLHVLVTALYAACAGALSLGTMWQVHRVGWMSGPTPVMSATLNEQIELARALNRYSDATALTDVWNYLPSHYPQPHALWALRLLFPASANEPRRESGKLVIRYHADPAVPGGNGRRIELIEAANETDIPANAERVTLAPPKVDTGILMP